MGKKKLQKLYTLAGRKHERDESGEFYIKYIYNGFLLANDRYKTKMKPEDLPDSFIFISGGGVHHGFLDAAGVIDLKYVPNLWINHLLKDDCLVISYTGKIGNEEKHYCFENEDQCIYGNSILYFLEGARKYSGIDITPIIEQLKNKVGSLIENDNQSTIVNGRDITSGKPRSVSVSSADILFPVRVYVDKIIEYAELVLKKLPAEVSAVMCKNGIYLAGGVTGIAGFADYVADRLQMEAHLGRDAQMAVVLGGGRAIGSSALLKRIQM